MAKLNDRIIEIASSLPWDDDLIQDFYLWHLKYGKEEMSYPYMDVERIKAYILSVLMNIRSNKLMKERRRQQLDKSEAERIKQNLGYRESNADPLQVLSADESLSGRLNDMSPLLRETLLAFIQDGLSPEDIAKRDGDDVEAVRKRITRARNQLKGNY